MNICSPIRKHCAPFSDTSPVHNMFAIDCNKSSVNFTGSIFFRLQKPNHAGFGIGAFIVTTRYTHNVKKFAPPTAAGNYLHSTEHTKWLIWYNEATARVVCANVLYFPNEPHIFLMRPDGWSKRVAVHRMYKINFNIPVCICWYHYGTVKYSHPITGPDRSFALQEVEVPRITRQQVNGSCKVVRPTHRLTFTLPKR